MPRIAYPDTPLAGDHVRLAPLQPDHLDALCAVGLDPALWTWNPRQVTNRDDLEAYLQVAFEGRDRARCCRS
ncbi:MAG: hypothetical protein R2834_07280 [Rhodothermales bacterium]